MSMTLRPARKTDAAELAQLVNMAGEGMPLALWTGMAEDGHDPWEVGKARAERDEGSFSWRNAVVAEVDGAVAGMVITYKTAAEPEEITPDTPPVFVPLIALENKAPETCYVNVLATMPQHRRKGVARQLMAQAEEGKPTNGMSLIVAEGNATARAFYEGLGYRETARATVVEGEGWCTDHKDWILITKR